MIEPRTVNELFDAYGCRIERSFVHGIQSLRACQYVDGQEICLRTHTFSMSEDLFKAMIILDLLGGTGFLCIHPGTNSIFHIRQNSIDDTFEYKLAYPFDENTELPANVVNDWATFDEINWK